MSRADRQKSFGTMGEMVKAIIADLRHEADRSNARAITNAGPGGNPETRRAQQARHEDLRRLANKYEGWTVEAETPGGEGR